MPRYLLSVHVPAEPPPLGDDGSAKADLWACAETGVFDDRLVRARCLVFAQRLEAATTATTVDARGESPVITDGPHVEAPDHLDAFWVIEVPDLDVALTLAVHGSRACGSAVEVRPLRTERSVRALLEW